MKVYNYSLLLSLFLCFSQASFAQLGAVVSNTRAKLIVDAFNQMPEKLFKPLSIEDVELGEFDGRVVVNRSAKFTYYVHFENAADPNSLMTLIPMSTSRFAPAYYQTDEWWDANKPAIDAAKREGRPAPRQDVNEVEAWLNEMKLSTNPDVVIINPARGSVQRQSLQKFLIDYYLKYFTENGNVILYRGAERPNEFETWKSGQMPRGVRYWTPTANYAWRYARKNTQFVQLLSQGETPLFRFEIPVQEFINMIGANGRDLTLGVELTKNSHFIFDRSRYFGDHLFSGLPFLGAGPVGVEFEVRSSRYGAMNMVRYFKRAATLDDMARDRIRVLERASQRVQRQAPHIFDTQFRVGFETRIKNAKVEYEGLSKIFSKVTEVEFSETASKLSNIKPEVTYIDGFSLANWLATSKKNFLKLECRKAQK